MAENPAELLTVSVAQRQNENDINFEVIPLQNFTVNSNSTVNILNLDDDSINSTPSINLSSGSTSTIRTLVLDNRTLRYFRKQILHTHVYEYHRYFHNYMVNSDRDIQYTIPLYLTQYLQYFCEDPLFTEINLTTTSNLMRVLRSLVIIAKEDIKYLRKYNNLYEKYINTNLDEINSFCAKSALQDHVSLFYKYKTYVTEPQMGLGNFFGINDKHRSDPYDSDDTEDETTFTITKKLVKKYTQGDVDLTIDNLNSLAAKIEELLSTLPLGETKSILESLNKLLKQDEPKKEVSYTTFYTSLLVFIATTILALRERTPTYIMLSLASGTFMMSTDYFRAVVLKLKNLAAAVSYITQFLIQMTMQKDKTEAQFGANDLHSFCESIGGIFIALMIKDTPVSKLPSEIYRSVCSWDRFSGNLSSILKNIIDSIQDIYNYIIKLTSTDDTHSFMARWLSTNDLAIDEYVKDVSEIFEEYSSFKLKETQNTYFRITDLIQKGTTLALSFKGKQSNRIPQVLSGALFEMKKLREKFSSYDFSSQGLRVEPAFVLFVGPPGIGKSVVSRQITHYLVGTLMESDTDQQEYVKNCDNYIYYRKAGEEYWEGFNSHHIAAVYDDIHQAVDAKGSSFSEALEVIHTVNSEPFKPNMAFDMKGKVYFRCKLMVASTNKVDPEFETINEPGAYYRRCKFAYFVSPKTEYTTDATVGLELQLRKIDFDKLRKDENGKPILGGYALQFQKINYSRNGKDWSQTISPIPVSHGYVEKEVHDEMIKNQAIFEQQASKLKMERLRAVNDMRELKGDKPLTEPQSQMEFNHDETYLENDYFTTFLDTPELPEKLNIDDFTQKDVNLCADYVRRVTSSAYRDHILFTKHLILTKLYVTNNKYEMSEPRAEEVFLAFYTRFGEAFIELIDDKNIIPKDFCDLATTMVFRHGKFDRRFSRIISPTLDKTTFGKILTELKNMKDHIYKRYIKDSWVDILYTSVKLYIMANPYISYILAGSVVIQLILTTLNKVYFTPQAERLNKEYVKYNNHLITAMTLEKLMTTNTVYLEDIVFTLEDEELNDAEKLNSIKRSINSIRRKEQDICEEDNTTDDYVEEPQSIRAKEQKGNRKPNIRFKGRAKLAPKPQMGLGIDPNGNDMLKKIVNNNCYTLEMSEQEDLTYFQTLGSVTFILDKYLLIPQHFIERFSEMIAMHGEKIYDNRIRLTQCGENKTISHTVTLEQFLGMSDQPIEEELKSVRSLESCADLLVMKVDIEQLGIGIRKSIIKHIATKENHRKLGQTTSGVLISPKQGMISMALVTADKGFQGTPYSIGKTDTKAYYAPVNGYTYHAPTEHGDCGAILALDKPRLGSVRIFGIHVAGTKTLKMGHAETLIREEIEEAIKSFEDETIVYAEFDETRPQCNTLISDGQFTSLELLDQSIPLNYKSNIVPSPLHSLFFPATEKPAPLKPIEFKGKLTDPWDHNLKKYCKGNILVDRHIINDIVDQMYVDLVSSSPVSVENRVLSFEEAVLSEDIFDLGSIPRDSSPGYPDVLHPVPNFPKSTRYFGNGQEYDLTNKHCDKLREDILIYINKCKERKRDNDILAIDNLKDQVLPILKIEENLKGRVFSSFPKKKIITDKMYYGAFSSYMRRNAINNGYALGVNPYDTEWNEIAKRLLYFGDATLQNIGAGDYSCFDGSQKAIILNIIHERLICRWYNNPEENAIRQMLFLDVTNSYHIRGNLIYEWNGGMTSGNYLTIVVNCLYNSFAYYYTWYKLHDFKQGSLLRFKDNVIYIILGDDNAFAVSPEYSEKFTETTMSQALVDICLVYTSETKDGTNSTLRKITDIEFLKRSFKFTAAYGWLAPMRLSSILEDVYWTRKNEEYMQIARDNVDVLFKELALHGPCVYSQYSEKLNLASIKHLRYYSRFSVYSVALYAVLSQDMYF